LLFIVFTESNKPRFVLKLKSKNIFVHFSSRQETQGESDAHAEQTEKAGKILVKNPEAQNSLGRYRSRWEGNVKIYLKEIA
jgi:hypothetical protein